MTEEERRFNEEALNTDLCDLIEKYSGEMGVPVFGYLDNDIGGFKNG